MQRSARKNPEDMPCVAFLVAEEDNCVPQFVGVHSGAATTSELIRAYPIVCELILEVLPVADNSPCYNSGYR
jgi:hypothetical protein